MKYLLLANMKSIPRAVLTLVVVISMLIPLIVGIFLVSGMAGTISAGNDLRQRVQEQKAEREASAAEAAAAGATAAETADGPQTPRQTYREKKNSIWDSYHNGGENDD